jgi:ABC-type transporter Mla MlaB component/DNA-directed RNA polymerase subunit RPC12/RpoP
MEIALQVTNENGVDRVRYVGPINEESEVHLGQLLNKLGPKCEINFAGIEYVNSCGVRAWINFMRELEKNGRQVSFVECPPEIVMQINMIPSFRGKAKVNSVYASYECGECGHTDQVLFESGRNMPTDGGSLPPVKCVKCGENMEMEEMEDEYFAFTAAA